MDNNLNLPKLNIRSTHKLLLSKFNSPSLSFFLSFLLSSFPMLETKTEMLERESHSILWPSTKDGNWRRERERERLKWWSYKRSIWTLEVKEHNKEPNNASAPAPRIPNLQAEAGRGWSMAGTDTSGIMDTCIYDRIVTFKRCTLPIRQIRKRKRMPEESWWN